MVRSSNLHFTKIFEHFSGDVYTDYDSNANLSDQLTKLIIVHFTNRSGSNYFCDLLSNSTGRQSLYESLNWDAVINQSKRLSIRRFTDYISLYLCEHPSIVKANTDQLYMLAKWGYIRPCTVEKISESPCILSVQRGDAIAQAISFAIATQTGKYASFQGGQKQQNSEVVFNPDLITRLINGFGKEYQDFLVLTSALGYQAHKVYYEDLVINPKKTIADACTRLGIAFSLEDVKSKFEKQADNINSLHKQMYTASLELT